MTIGKTVKTRTLPLAAVALVSLATSPAWASPLTVLKQRTDRIAQLLKQSTTEGTAPHARKKASMKKIVRAFLDYQELAKRSLWMHWKERKSSERKEFVQLLRQLIEDRVLSNLTSNAEFTVEYGETTEDGGEAAVKTVVRIPDKPEIEMEYKFSKRSGRWMIYDLITDGTSLVRNYRSQFNRIIQRDGYPQLVRKMRDKLKNSESSGQVASALVAG
jgi:phospholipid transport system substrate-binding protein